VFFSQNGTGSHELVVGQSGEGNLTRIVQGGTLNPVEFMGTPAQGNGDTSVPKSRDEVATIDQTGDRNTMAVSQSGVGSELIALQSGDDNVANVDQSGEGNFADVIQASSGNLSLVAQSGSSNRATIRQ
jgi:hypothetical protein